MEVVQVVRSGKSSKSRRGVRRAGEDIWIKVFSSAPSFKQYQDYWTFELRA